MDSIRIETGKMGQDTRVFVGDVDISRFVLGLEIKIKPGHLNTVNLTCFGDQGPKLITARLLTLEDREFVEAVAAGIRPEDDE